MWRWHVSLHFRLCKKGLASQSPVVKGTYWHEWKGQLFGGRSMLCYNEYWLKNSYMWQVLLFWMVCPRAHVSGTRTVTTRPTWGSLSHFHPIYFGWNLALRSSWTVRPGCWCNKYNFSARWLLPEAGSETSILIKHFTFNYISQFAHGVTGFHHRLSDCSIRTAFQGSRICASEKDSKMKSSLFLFTHYIRSYFWNCRVSFLLYTFE